MGRRFDSLDLTAFGSLVVKPMLKIEMTSASGRKSVKRTKS